MIGETEGESGQSERRVRFNAVRHHRKITGIQVLEALNLQVFGNNTGFVTRARHTHGANLVSVDASNEESETRGRILVTSGVFGVRVEDVLDNHVTNASSEVLHLLLLGFAGVGLVTLKTNNGVRSRDIEDFVIVDEIGIELNEDSNGVEIALRHCFLAIIRGKHGVIFRHVLRDGKR